MKIQKIIAITLGTILAAAAILFLQDYYIKGCIEDERNATVAWEKHYAKDALAYELSYAFKNVFEEFESKTGQKADDFGIEDHPKVFAYRLSNTKGFGGENLEDVRKDIHAALLQVLVLSEQLGDTKFSNSDEIRQVLNNRRLSTEAYARAQARIDAIDNRIKDKEWDIEKMTWDSIPANRLAELRQMNRLQYNN